MSLPRSGTRLRRYLSPRISASPAPLCRPLVQQVQQVQSDQEAPPYPVAVAVAGVGAWPSLRQADLVREQRQCRCCLGRKEYRKHQASWAQFSEEKHSDAKFQELPLDLCYSNNSSYRLFRRFPAL